MNTGSRNEVALSFNRRACWGVSWFVGYAFLMIWWFALKDWYSSGIYLAYFGAALIAAGLIVFLIPMRPIIIIGPRGFKFNTGYFGRGEFIEIAWEQVKSVFIQKRYMRGRAAINKNAHLVLTFELTTTEKVRSDGYFKWRPETSELDMYNSVTTGGFKRIVSIIGDFQPNLKIGEVRGDLIGPVIARLISVLLLVAVVGTGTLAATGRMYVLDNLAAIVKSSIHYKKVPTLDVIKRAFNSPLSDKGNQQKSRRSSMRSKSAAQQTKSSSKTALVPSAVYHKEDSKKAEQISVSISNKFVPVQSGIGGSWSPLTDPLSNKRPIGIVKEPPYQGNNQKYGNLQLGTQDNKTYYFAFDLIEGTHPVLYFDRNQNGDLTDDGGPLYNQGSGIFATEIKLPIRQLIKELNKHKDFSIWFFTNDLSWKKGYVNHYSRTKMKGNVTINGKTYMAYISERKTNDADFTNDGIYLDINGNGKIERLTEFIKPGHVLRIDGKEYLFKIYW